MPCILVTGKKVVFTGFAVLLGFTGVTGILRVYGFCTGILRVYGKRAYLRTGRFGGARGRHPFYALFRTCIQVNTSKYK